MVDVKIDYSQCETSGFCLEVCPEDVFELRGIKMVVARAENCTECWLCVKNCPTGAVSLD